MDIPYTPEELRAATHELIVAQRPASPATSARSSSAAPARWACTRSTPRSRSRSRSGSGAPTSATRASTTAFAPRSPPGGASTPTRVIPAAKASGQYLNSILAKIEADKAGYEEGILLDERGMVCEGTGENLFIVKDGMIATPGFSADILGGINRAVGDRDRPRPRLRGRGARRRPRRALHGRRGLHDRHRGRADADPRDRRPPVGTGEPGPITRAVQRVFEDALHGRAERYAEWNDVVPPRRHRAP